MRHQKDIQSLLVTILQKQLINRELAVSTMSMIKKNQFLSKIKSDLPLIPLRDVVVFPGIVTTLFVGRGKSVEALNIAMSTADGLVLAISNALSHDVSQNDK